MKITESRVKEIHNWLGEVADHAPLFQDMAMLRDTVENLLSVLRAGNWREVHTGRRCMQLEVTYDYAAWERLMYQVEAVLAQQTPAEPQPGWYCAHCQRGVDAREVTYSEQHEICGRYIANDDPPPPSASVGVQCGECRGTGEVCTGTIDGTPELFDCDRCGGTGNSLTQQPAAVDAHELWAAAQLAPGEGIEDGVSRIENILHHTSTQLAAMDEAAAIRAFEDHFQADSDDPYFEGELKLWLTAWRKAIAAQPGEQMTDIIERLRIESRREPHEPIWRDAIDEIEVLRMEVAAQRTRADAMAGEAIKHEARSERLAETLRYLRNHTSVNSYQIELIDAAQASE